MTSLQASVSSAPVGNKPSYFVQMPAPANYYGNIIINN